jgi:O-antigen/teichoic acid export membrane protein
MIGDFTKNTFFNILQQIFSSVFKVLITIILARKLGPENQGLFTMSMLPTSLFLILLTGGISFGTVFYLGRKKYSLREAMVGNLFFSFFFSLFALFFSFLVIFFWGEKIFPGVPKNFFYLSFLIIFPSCFLDYFSGILLALKKIKDFALLSFFLDFFRFLFVFFLIFLLSFKVKAAILAEFFALLFSIILLIYLLREEFKEISLKFPKDYLKDVFFYGVKSHLSAIFAFLQYRVDHLFINFFLNPLAVGFYAISTRVAEGFWLFSYALITVFFPTIVSQKDSFKNKFTPLVLRQSIILFFFFCFILYFLSPLVIEIFFSRNYLPSILPLRILLFGTFFISLWRILSQDIFARGFPMLNVKISFFAFCLNVFLNLILIPLYGLVGAAISSSFSYCFMFFFALFYYLKISKSSLKEVFLPTKNDFDFYQRIFNFLKAKTAKIFLKTKSP